MTDEYIEWLAKRMHRAEMNAQEARSMGDTKGAAEYRGEADAFKRAKLEYEAINDE